MALGQLMFLSAGAPYAVLSSTPGKAEPILRTVSKLILRLHMTNAIIGKNRSLFQGSQLGQS
ncbi:MAG: hypothetical protein WBV55_06185 [Candidatus Sulfotelmatobacter sp.]